jgi:DNA-binding MarR family transcriptional regulator
MRWRKIGASCVHALNALDVHGVNKVTSATMSPSNTDKVDNESPVLLLGVLSAVEQNSNVTQRSMSSELGVALGLANAVLKRCVRKGFIKISTAPVNRYAYYLTPTGFSEKARLTAEYLRVSFDLFRKARIQYTEIFARLAARNSTRIALVGASELAEAALLSAREANVSVVGIVDPAFGGGTHLGFAIVDELANVAGGCDAVVLCDMRDPQASYLRSIAQAAAAGLYPECVVGPALLRLRPPPPVETVAESAA